MPIVYIAIPDCYMYHMSGKNAFSVDPVNRDTRIGCRQLAQLLVCETSVIMVLLGDGLLKGGYERLMAK